MIDQAAINEISASYHVEKTLNPRDNAYIRASGIGSCKRQIAYRVKWHQEGREELPTWSHGLFTFDLGHGIHYRLQSRLSNVGPLKWVDAEPCFNGSGQLEWRGNVEIPLKNDEYRIAGHCDGLTRPLKKVTRVIDGVALETIEVTDEDDPDGKRYILDIKSITARERLKIDQDPNTGMVRNHQVLPSAFEKLSAPKDEHISQVSLYAWMTTQKDFKTDRLDKPLLKTPSLMIIYVAKDLDPAYYAKKTDDYPAPKHLLNSPYKVFTLDVNPKHLTVLLRKASGIWKSLEAGELPPRDYHHKPERPAYPCLDCPFRQECYKEEGYFALDDTTLPPLVQLRNSLINPDHIMMG